MLIYNFLMMKKIYFVLHAIIAGVLPSVLSCEKLYIGISSGVHKSSQLSF